MEAFESFVALALEGEDLFVSEAVKFPVTRQTAKAAYAETQTHGFEVDLVRGQARPAGAGNGEVFPRFAWRRRRRGHGDF